MKPVLNMSCFYFAALTNKECLGLVGIKPSRSEFLGPTSSGNDSANSGRSIPKPSKLGRLKYAGYSAEFLDRVEPNGNILNKDAPGMDKNGRVRGPILNIRH